MVASVFPPSTQARTSHNAMLVGLREDWDEYLRECLCKIPPAPLTLVVIEKIKKSPVDSGAPIPKKEKTIMAKEPTTIFQETSIPYIDTNTFPEASFHSFG